MSARSILGLAGAYFFGPIGGFIGSTIGGLIDGTDDVENFGPRLQDRKVTTTGYGQMLPIVYGTMQVAGLVIEPKNLVLNETVIEEEEGGKGGGPTVTNVSYSYDATFAVALCEGPIIGVSKIWLGNELVYDFSASATASAIIASNQSATGITIYTGSETQTADSTLEAINGAGNTPAYRGTAYIVFDALQLEKYGNRIPNIRAEVVAAGSAAASGLINENLTHTTIYGGDVITSFDNGVFRVWDKVEVTGKVRLIDADNNYIGEEIIDPAGTRYYSKDNFPPALSAPFPTDEIGTLNYQGISYFVYMENPANLSRPAGTFRLEVYWYNGLTFSLVKDIAATLAQDKYVVGVVLSEDQKRLLVVLNDGGSPAGGDTVGTFIMYDEGLNIVQTGTVDSTGAPTDVDYNAFGWGNASAFPFSQARSGMLENDYTNLWVVSANGGDLNRWEINSSDVLVYVENVSPLLNGPFLSGSIWADGGICFLVGRAVGGSTGYAGTFTRQGLLTAGPANLSDIVDDIEERAGITSANRDNTALTQTIDGYMIARQTPARRAIEPLQTAEYFDVIETGYKLTAVNRGGASVATLDITDLGAREGSSAAVFPLSKTRTQEVELPIEVTVQYINAARGYEVGIQRNNRIVPRSTEKINIELAISMSDNKAKQIVEVLHFNFWTERNIYSFSLMPEYTYLDPSDIITVTDGGTTHTIRITSISVVPGGVLQCQGVADRPAIYASDSTGADTSDTGVTVTLNGPTKAIYGDWPAFTNANNDQALCIAMAGFLSGWSGGISYRSIDNGASYSQVAFTSSASKIGYATDALPDGDVETFDRASTVNIKMISGVLSSSTELAVLNGANPIMVGSELIQFVNATLEADGTYTLSTLLRGRKGTEWAMAGHAAGEDAVFIDTTVKRPATTLNVERKYKAVTVGNFLADSFPTSFTYTGVNLKPYAPTHIRGARNSSEDLAISWVNRSRLETAPLWSPPVGEDSEEYEIDILGGSPLAVIRTITAISSPAYTYTAAMQAADFGSPIPASVEVKIYQKSATVGRGYEGAATL